MKKETIALMMVALFTFLGCSSTPQDNNESIREAEALSIVLTEVGLKEDDVRLLRVKKDYDNLTYTYDIEFYYDNNKYDYEVSQTGEIIKSEKEMSKTNYPDEPKYEGITEDEAIRIAFEHAEVVEADVQFIKIEKDYERQSFVYEIEFYADDIEYDYEIAADGTVVKFEQEQRSSKKGELMTSL